MRSSSRVICLCVLLLSLSAALPGHVSAQDQGLHWPLEMAPALSSTFGETRSTAFHAGIDLKTWGKTGYAVHAAGEGWIERARMSPWGFGRVIYLRLTDGRIAVYAHLDSFFTPVQQRIRAEQQAQGHYSVQLWFEKGEIPVKRGQVIAATGQTGAGPPHLHFELRDSGNVPLNALLHAFRVADTQAPTIRRLLVVPRGPGSLADGGHEPVMVPVRWQAAQQRFVATKAVSVFGRIGIGVESFDTADAANNKLAPLWQALRVGGQEVFRSRLHRVPIADWHQVSLDRWRLQGHVFSNLFQRPGNRLPFYTSDGNAGWIFAGGDGLPPGAHDLQIVAADVAGNESLATIRLEVAASYGAALNGDGEQSTTTGEGASGGRQTGRDRSVGSASSGAELIPYERFAVLRIRGGERDRASLAPVVTISAGPQDEAGVTIGNRVGHEAGSSIGNQGGNMVGDRSGNTAGIRFGHPPTAATGHAIALVPQAGGFVGLVSYAHVSDGSGVAAVNVHFEEAAIDTVLLLSTQTIRPGQAQRLDYHEGHVALHLAAGSAYEEIVPQVTPVQPQPSPGLRLPAIGDAAADGATAAGWTDERRSPLPGAGVLGFDVQPQTVSFDKWARISFQVPQGRDPAKLGVYVSDGDGGWVFIGNDLEESRVSARIRAFGTFALLEDVAPPTVSTLAPRTRAWLDDRRPLLQARVVDHESGIGAEADLAIELNGRPLIHIYDPEADIVEARPGAPLPDGEYVWMVRARDQSGNETEATDIFGLR